MRKNQSLLFKGFLLAGLTGLAVIAGLALSGCSPSRTVEAFRVMGDVGAGMGPSSLKENTARPRKRTVGYDFEGENREADLYLPGTGRAKALTVLVPGVVPEGKDHPQLVAFANTMARARFAVFVPDLPNLRRLNVSAHDASALSAAVRSASAQGNVVGEAGIGVIAFSYAAGPALIAALSPDTRNSVAFVYAIGPYYDIEAVITFMTTGHYRTGPDEPWQRIDPNPYAKWVFVLSNAARLENPDDRRLLTRIARRKIDDPNADVSALTDMLGPEGQSVYDLLTNTAPERTRQLISRLPPAVLEDIRALDLSRRDFGALTARLILVHGRNDNMVPYTESLDLAAAAERAGGHVNIYVIDNLKHIDLELGGIADLYRLWRSAYILLKERDRMPVPDFDRP